MKKIANNYLCCYNLNFMKKQETSSRHTRSSSRYSINRIKSKQPKASKANASVFEIDTNKENQHHRNHNRSHFQTSREPKTAQYEELQNQHEVAVVRMEKQFNSQMAEIDMTVMGLKNALKKVEFENKKKDKAILDAKKNLQNKEKLLATLNCQNTSFSSALDILKLQSHQLTAANESMMNQSAALKKQIMDRTNDVRKLQEKLSKTQKDLHIFNSLQPRLRELSSLQDKLINQNQQAKQQSEIFYNTLKSIDKIISNLPPGKNTIEYHQIQTLISGFLE